jgi:hypothetical protein
MRLLRSRRSRRFWVPAFPKRSWEKPLCPMKRPVAAAWGVQIEIDGKMSSMRFALFVLHSAVP